MRAIFLTAASLALGPAWPAMAQPEACFCLSNAQYGYFEWGCLTPEDGATDRAVCLSVGAEGTTVIEVEIGDGWERVQEGHGMCLPCMPPVASADLPIRFRDLYSDAEGKEDTQ